MPKEIYLNADKRLTFGHPKPARPETLAQTKALTQLRSFVAENCQDIINLGGGFPDDDAQLFTNDNRSPDILPALKRSHVPQRTTLSVIKKVIKENPNYVDVSTERAGDIATHLYGFFESIAPMPVVARTKKPKLNS